MDFIGFYRFYVGVLYCKTQKHKTFIPQCFFTRISPFSLWDKGFEFCSYSCYQIVSIPQMTVSYRICQSDQFFLFSAKRLRGVWLGRTPEKIWAWGRSLPPPRKPTISLSIYIMYVCAHTIYVYTYMYV